jgi:hypothetical protein
MAGHKKQAYGRLEIQKMQIRIVFGLKTNKTATSVLLFVLFGFG